MTTSLLFGLITLVLVGLSIYLTHKRTLIAKDRGELFLKRKKKRFIGLLLLFPAALSFMVTGVSLYNTNSLPGIIPGAASSDTSTSPDTASPTNSTTATTPEAAPAAVPPPATATQPAPAPQLSRDQQIDAELKKLTAILNANPNDAVAYGNRGIIYSLRKSYGLAEKDFQSALKLNPKLTKIAFNLAEIQLEQKKFDTARADFTTLQQDPDLGELASYQLFMCDLLGRHENIASKELDAFNQTGSGASYYFANIAWLLYRHKPDDARDMLDSANRIYPPDKIGLYSATLTEFGYLPIPPKPGN